MKKTLLIGFLFSSIFSLHAQVLLQQVKDVNPQGGSEAWQFTVSNDKIFFSAHNADPINKLWVTDGTDANTVLLGPATGNSIRYVTAFKNKVFFSYTGNDNNNELWVSDGTAAGTKLFAELYPGNTGSYPRNLTVANDRLFFLANNPDGERRLYMSDGTEAGTVVLRNDYNDAFNGGDTFAVFHNNILFESNNGSSTFGFWQTDGVTSTLLKAGVYAGNTGSSAAELNGKLYLCVGDDAHGNELWSTDGTEAGTQLVKNIGENDGDGSTFNSNPQSFITYNGKVYFSADDGTHGQELWSTDGTEAGTQLVKDVFPGADGSLPYQNVVYHNKLYFAAWKLNELWVSDGTESGTQKVAATLPATKFAAVWNNTMYLISGESSLLYQSDGTTNGTGLASVSNSAAVITRYYQSGSDQYFLPYKGDLYFAGSCSGLTNSIEPVKLTLGLLPLHLLSFSGESRGNTDVLQWSATNEINSASFVVEQSKDGNYFIPAGVVAASGSTGTVKSYTYQQASALNPGGYYRLKMLDKDGSYTYSSVILIHHTGSRLSAVYDAVRKQVIISNPTGQTCYWQLIGASGAVVKKGVSSDAVISIPAGSVAAGVYQLRYTSKDGAGTVKMGVF